MKVDFEWRIVPAEGHSSQAGYVIERLQGYDYYNQYGPMPIAVCNAFVMARRNFVRKRITTRYEAVRVFEPRPDLDSMLKRQILLDNKQDKEQP